MNRGSVSSGSAAATAGLKRSVCPTASVAPDAAAAAISASASASERAIGFSTSTGDAALEKRQRDLAVQLGRHGDRDGVDLAEQLAVVGQRRVRRRRGDRLRARAGLVSTTADELARPAATTGSARDACPRWPTPIDGDAQRDARRSSHGCARAGRADDRDAGVVRRRSNDRVAVDHQRLAGVDRQRASRRRAFIASIVATPTTGTSKRMS